MSEARPGLTAVVVRHRTVEGVAVSAAHRMPTQIMAILALMCALGGCANLPKASASEELCLLPPIQDQDSEPSVFMRDGPRASRVGQRGAFPRAGPSHPVFDELSPDVLRVAGLLDMRDVVHLFGKLERLAAQDNERAERSMVKVRQLLSDRLLAALADTRSLTGYLDCEISRTNHRAALLKSVSAKHQRLWTIFGAVLGDSLIGITGGTFALFNLGVGAAVASIAGGSVSTGFGAIALYGGTKRMSLSHPQDVLSELWDAPPDPKLYPLPVWRFLNSPQDGQDGTPTKREMLIAYWRKQGWLGEPGSETESRRLTLFFRGGGEYQLEDLRARAQMLEVVKGSGNLLNRELHRLLKEI